MINTEDFNAREFEERGAISLSLSLPLPLASRLIVPPRASNALC